MKPAATFGRGDGRAIARAAAEWCVREQQGLDTEGVRELERWLRADPRHAEAYAETQETSALLDRLRRPAVPAPLEEVGADRRSFRARRWLPLAVGFAAAVLLGGAIWQTAWRREPESRTFARSAQTNVGGWQRVDLPDGSQVLLNTASNVEVRYTAAERRVQLVRGEAFFTVAKDPARPFRVEVESVTVRAVGTAFNVRRRPARVDVIVSEGTVKVDSSREGPADSPAVGAGQRATIEFVAKPNARVAPRIAVADIEPNALGNALAWQDRRLKFSATPLAEVVAEFNRYNTHPLVIMDEQLAAEKFGGAFAPNGQEALLELLQENFGVVAERRANETILRRAR